jgi:uncharacterized repeat protein (TIGR01451 family)
MFLVGQDLPKSRRRAALLPALATLAVWAAPDTPAQVLRTITIDGVLSDWSDVLADPLQTALDGPAGGLLDRDAPVPTTGRDLTTFAWTYDDTHLFLLVGRVASASNIQRFWFYLDLDEDGLLESWEPVLLVEWRGSNRRTDTYLWRYTPASPGGDPLVDGSGFADGWTMQGAVSAPFALESVFGGEVSGVRMEARVPWTALGFAGPSPVQFHVASSASSNLPSQIHDNMAGPGGGIGSTRIPGVLFVPDRDGTVSAGGRVVFAHTVTNTGSLPDRFRLTATSTGDFVPVSLTFHLDTNGDGLLDPGDTAATETGVLLPGAGQAVLLEVVVPYAIPDGSEATVTGTATSVARPAVLDAVTDRITVATPEITLVKSVDRNAALPGEALLYTVVYTGGGSAPAHSVVLIDGVPAETAYAPGSASGPGTLIEFSSDGGATYGPAESEDVTHIRWIRLAPLAPGENGTVSFEVRVR